MSWRFVHIGFELAPFEIDGLDVWNQKWRQVTGDPVRLPHPTYPAQTHNYWIYDIGDTARPTRFAASELSAAVWGFYVPETVN